MRWKRGRKRKKKAPKPITNDKALRLINRKSFEKLAELIYAKGLKHEFIDNDESDTLPMFIFRNYVFDEFSGDLLPHGSEKEEKLASDIELLMKIIIISKSFNPNERNKVKDTLLHMMCKTSTFSNVTERLIEHDDIDINAVNQFDCTPLDICRIYGNSTIEELLLSKGALSAEEVTKEKSEKQNTYASLEEYRRLKEEMYMPKSARIRRLLDPNVLDKKWI